MSIYNALGPGAPTPDEIVEHWQRRCDRYARWNRRWFIFTGLCLGISVAALLASLIGPPAQRTLMGAISAVIFFALFSALQMASMTVAKLLRCPNCRKPVQPLSGGPEEINHCGCCGASFRFALPQHKADGSSTAGGFGREQDGDSRPPPAPYSRLARFLDLWLDPAPGPDEPLPFRPVLYFLAGLALLAALDYGVRHYLFPWVGMPTPGTAGIGLALFGLSSAIASGIFAIDFFRRRPALATVVALVFGAVVLVDAIRYYGPRYG